MGRPETRRPFYSRPGERRPFGSRPETIQASSSITITAAVLTFTAFDACTLTLTFSAAPGDNAGFGGLHTIMSLHAGGIAWDLVDKTAVISGTTLTITDIVVNGRDSNYNSAQDLFNYDGTDSTNLPNVAAVVDLPVTFTGGALAVPSGNGIYNEGTSTLVQIYSRTLGNASGNFTEGSGVWNLQNILFNSPAQFSLGGDDSLIINTLTLSGVATGVARWSQAGTNTSLVDDLGRPVPPHADHPLSAA